MPGTPPAATAAAPVAGSAAGSPIPVRTSRKAILGTVLAALSLLLGFLWTAGLALTVMAHALKALEQEFQSSGRLDQFQTLKPWLVGETKGLSQAEAAHRLSLSEGAVKVAVHRLRKRFRELIRLEIAQTLPEGDDVEEELRYLVQTLSAT